MTDLHAEPADADRVHRLPVWTVAALITGTALITLALAAAIAGIWAAGT